MPAWCKDADTRSNALGRIAPVLNSTIGAAWWPGACPRPAGHELPETVDALIETTKVGADVGLVKVNNLPALADANDAARAFDQSSIAAVEKMLAAADAAAGEERLSLVGSEVGADLDRIVAFLEASAPWVDAGLAAGGGRGRRAADRSGCQRPAGCQTSGWTS